MSKVSLTVLGDYSRVRADLTCRSDVMSAVVFETVIGTVTGSSVSGVESRITLIIIQRKYCGIVSPTRSSAVSWEEPQSICSEVRFKDSELEAYSPHLVLL
jgi:hypothetical protein